METIKLWARNGDAVRQALELGELVHLETASEELTDEFLLFAIQRIFPPHFEERRTISEDYLLLALLCSHY